MGEFEKNRLDGETKYEYNKRTLEAKLEKSKNHQIAYLFGGSIAGGIAGWFAGGYALDEVREMTGWFAENAFWHRANASMLGIGFMAQIGAYAAQAAINEYREKLRFHYYYPKTKDTSHSCGSDPQAKL